MIRKRITSTIQLRIISTRQYIMILPLISLICLLTFLALIPTGQAITRAGLLTLDLIPQSPVSPLRTSTSPPLVEEIRFSYKEGEARGQLYRPVGGGSHSSMILSLGYGPNPKDPQLLQVSEDLARLGIVVLIPDTPGLKAGNLESEDVEVLIGAFEYLSAQTYVNPDRIGFAGFCIGSSMALVAAEDLRINEQVSYVNVFGGYYDARHLLRAIAAQSSRYKGEEYPWVPGHQTIALFVQNVFARLDSPQDRRILRQLLQTPTQDISIISSELTPLGQLSHNLLTSSDPATVDTLLAQIPKQEMSGLRLISLSTGIERLKAKVFIMHDVSDPYVPVTESYRLADAISNPKQKVYTQFILFDHVRPSNSLSRLDSLKEIVRLFIYLCRLMIHITA